MSNRRFTVNPFGDLNLSSEDRTKLLDIADALVHSKFEEYEEYVSTNKRVDSTRWKKFSASGAATTYLERKKSNPESNMPVSLMVGPLPGTLDEIMFGLVSPTLESMRIKSSYLNDFSAAAVLGTIMGPTVEDPFRSVVIKWMEIDIPGASLGFLRNRDYVYLESTGIMHLKNGERVGYHLLHSVNFPQTFGLPSRIRGDMSLCAIFRQEGNDKTDCFGTGIMDPRGEMIRSMAVSGMVHATMAGLKYSYCGQMKKLAWLLEQRHAELRERGTPVLKPVCVTCSKPARKSSAISRFSRSSTTCKLCFGVLCGSCKVSKKLSFITPDLELSQRKVRFCVKCLLEANRLDTLEAARYQFVYDQPAFLNTYGSIASSFDSSRTDSTATLSNPVTIIPQFTIMGKKAKSPLAAQPPLKPLHISPPPVALDKHSCNAYEYDNLLTRSRLGVRPFPVPNIDVEQGFEVGNDGQWQVLRALDGVFCMATHHVLELVRLRRANFGLRWRDTNIERDADVAPPSCMMGPHWHLMLATWSVFCFLAAIVNILTYEKAGVVELGAGIFLSGMCLTCYALVGCSDPGIVNRIPTPLDDTYTYCDHCDSFRPEGALHCMDCRVCIEEYDHHCPWTGKCVGKGNVRYFYLWLLFLVLAFVYEVIEFTTYLLPPEGQDLLDSSDDSLEIIFPAFTTTPRL